MLVKKSANREWISSEYPGFERSLFRNNETGGRSPVVRLAQGSHCPRHAHHGTEEVVVLTGEVSIGGVALEEGDDLFTSIGEEHNEDRDRGMQKSADALEAKIRISISLDS